VIGRPAMERRKKSLDGADLAFETMQTMAVARSYDRCWKPCIAKEETMFRPRILVINPNSNVTVTKGIEEDVKPPDFVDVPEIVCTTLAEGPYRIESQSDVDSVAMPLRRLIESDNS